MSKGCIGYSARSKWESRGKGVGSGVMSFVKISGNSEVQLVGFFFLGFSVRVILIVQATRTHKCRATCVFFSEGTETTKTPTNVSLSLIEAFHAHLKYLLPNAASIISSNSR